MNELEKEQELRHLYHEVGMSTRDLAKYYNVGQTTIRRWLLDYAIEPKDSKNSKNSQYYLHKLDSIKNKISQSVTQFNINNGITHKVLCPECGNEYITSIKNPNKYCSRSCYLKHLEKQKLETKNRNKCFCIKCGKEVNARRKYCNDCLHIALKEHKTTKNRILTVCAQCGAKLEIIPSVFKKNKHNFCNMKCMSEYYSKHYSGINSPTWKGGKKHYFGNWYKMRDLARERDNYTCQLCGVTESNWHKQLDVHHIINYREFENKNEANQLDNLVCLCNKCHSYVHSKLNTEQKFIKHKI